MIKQSLFNGDFNGDNQHLVDAIISRSPCNQCMKSDVCVCTNQTLKRI